MHRQPLSVVIEEYAILTAIRLDTRRLHEIAINHLGQMLGRQPTLADLNDVTFSRYVAWRLARVSHETVRGECHKLIALWRWASGGKRRWIDPPEVKAPAPVHRLPLALDREQLEALWQAARYYPRMVGVLPGNVVLTALLYVLWDSSERIGAVYQIRRDLIDLKRGWLTIEPETRKGHTQGRLYKIRAATVAALTRLLAVADGPLPFAEVSLNAYYKHLPYLRESAGLPRWVTWHTLRKSHASHLVAAGGDARASLGHSSDAITVRHYLDARIASTGRQPCDLLFDPGHRHWWQRRVH